MTVTAAVDSPLFSQARRRPVIAVTGAVAAAALYGVNGSLSKVVLSTGLPAQRLSELRAAGSLLCLLLITLSRRNRGPRPALRELPRLLAYGILGIALVQQLYFVAIHRLHVGVALLFEFTAPLFIAIWLRFGQGRAVGRMAWSGLGLALVGLAFVADVGPHERLDPIGVAAALGAALGLAVYYVLGESLVVTRDVIPLTTWAFAAATGFWSIASPWTSFPWHTLGRTVSLSGRLEQLQSPVWLLVVGVVIVGTVLPYLLVLAALRHLPSTRVGVLGMLEPLLAAGFAYGWLGERLTAMQLCGGAVMLIGVALAQLTRGGWAGPNASSAV
ncbi:MAG: protein of unknown function transrane [Frankiales bacterium]|nr:protein of unknown function transrane [Frankiales bacterium]